MNTTIQIAERGKWHGKSFEEDKMNTLGRRIPLALLFGVFGFFTVQLNPDSFGLLDMAALFLFGAFAGINLGLFWADRKVLGHNNRTDD